jgi:2-oxoglutarate ferredoxin oxidoreductase subunit beta
VRLRKVAEDYDATDRDRAYAYIRDAHSKGEVVTGLLYIDEAADDMHAQAGTVAEPLTTLPYESLCPGNAELQKLQARFR